MARKAARTRRQPKADEAPDDEIDQQEPKPDEPERQQRTSSERKPKRARAKKRRGAGKRSAVRRAIYWSIVVTLWLGIAGAGNYRLGRRASAAAAFARRAETTADHPDRRHQRTAAGDARRPWRRDHSAEGIAPLSAESFHRNRGPAVLCAYRHRPDRTRARDRRQRRASRRLAGRLDDHPATRQESVSHPGTHGRPQAQEVALAFWLERKFSKNDILELYLNRILFRLGRLRRRGRGTALLREIRAQGHAGGSGHARGPREIAVKACADPQFRRRRAARAGGARRHDRRRPCKAGRCQGRAGKSAENRQPGRRRLGQLCRGLREGRAQRDRRAYRQRRHRRNHSRRQPAGRGGKRL